MTMTDETPRSASARTRAMKGVIGSLCVATSACAITQVLSSG